MIERSTELVTVFGGDGFIGRYVCEQLLQGGVRVRVACRDPRRAHFIQTLGQVGQIGFVRADITNAADVARAVDGADAVINLVGIMNGLLQAAHVDGPRALAEAARAAGASALVHISAIGADPTSASLYGQSKGAGELAVRGAFPKATIIRPSLVFGPEDQITNRFAAMAQLPILPVIAAQRKFQPVYVRDLAQAIARAALDPVKFGGKIFEIGGPQVLTMLALHRAVLAATGQTPEVIELPDVVGSLLAKFGWLPGAPLTKDQWLMLQRDNVVADGAVGLEAFGIRPTPLAAVAHEWLDRFHSGGRFAGRRNDVTAS